ncbi:MAG: hypothetical protein VX609_00150 [Verrucomicrobiota bacterium]|nr:hypothetical protein [Verrucomicrobiota bacterium]|tara:strand:- start:70 stop:279 length:210 start_codon:yes stop_codon:yes gene_type:complete
MIRVQRKYRVIKCHSLKELEEMVNKLIQKEYKDNEGFIYTSSGRWQCIGGIVKDEGMWLQSMVFIQEEE